MEVREVVVGRTPGEARHVATPPPSLDPVSPTIAYIDPDAVVDGSSVVGSSQPDTWGSDFQMAGSGGEAIPD